MLFLEKWLIKLKSVMQKTLIKEDKEVNKLSGAKMEFSPTLTSWLLTLSVYFLVLSR